MVNMVTTYSNCYNMVATDGTLSVNLPALQSQSRGKTKVTLRHSFPRYDLHVIMLQLLCVFDLFNVERPLSWMLRLSFFV